MLGMASPATLDRYADGARRLYAAHRPWTVIMAADERLRREMWNSMAEKSLAEPPAGYDPSTPRNSILRESAYSPTNSLAERWYFEVVTPLKYHGRNPQAAVVSKGSGR